MSNEELKLAFKVRQALDNSTENIDAAITARLYQARQHALARQKASVGGLAFAGLLGHFASQTLSRHGRTLIAAFALILGVVFSYYWNHFEQAAENEEVDSALLSDDLPPAAYLDKGFQAWLDRSAQHSQ